MAMDKGSAGILYLCATPIGNLEDMTPRAVRVLSEVDFIAAEDTRRTRQLLNHFQLKGRLVRYDEHSKKKQSPFFLEALLEGKNIALVSDAGFPGIADPGEELAALAIDNGIRVVPVPGANAALCALVASGLSPLPFFCGGFLPKSRKKRREQLELWKLIPATIVLYEAPHRLETVLGDILELWGDRKLAAARELTKLHEEFYRGTVSGCLRLLEEREPRGEFCLVLEGASTEAVKDCGDPLEAVRRLIEEGMDKKAALARIAKERKLPKRELYNKFVAEEGNEE